MILNLSMYSLVEVKMMLFQKNKEKEHNGLIIPYQEGRRKQTRLYSKETCRIPRGLSSWISRTPGSAGLLRDTGLCLHRPLPASAGLRSLQTEELLLFLSWCFSLSLSLSLSLSVSLSLSLSLSLAHTHKRMPNLRRMGGKEPWSLTQVSGPV